MKKRFIVSVTIASIATCGTARADSDVCAAVANATQKQIQEITKSYNEKFAAQQDVVKKRAAEITDDANKSKPDNAVEASLKFKIDISSHIETIKLDLPTVTVKNQTIILDLPEVTLKQQTWKYNIPQTKMEMKCINGPPETVCHNETKDFGLFKTDVPVCKWRAGKQICTDVPVVFMAPTQTILGVPEVTMKRQKIIMGIPEFKMETQTIKFSVPDFTLRNIEADMDKVKTDSDELNSSALQGSKILSDGMEVEVKKISTEGIANTLNCQRDDLNKQRNEATADIDKNISVVQVALAQAQSVGATQLIGSMQNSLAELVKSRKAVNDQFDDALKQIASKVPVIQ